MTSAAKTSWRNGILFKFSLGFAAVLLFAGALAVFISYRLEDVTEVASAISGHWMQTTRALSDISYQGQRFRVIEAAVVLAPPAERATEQKTLGEIRKAVAVDFARLADLAKSDQEDAQLRAIRSAWEAYLKLDDEFVDASGRSGAIASDLYRTKLRDSIHAFQDVLKKAVKYNGAEADKAAVNGDEVGAASQRDLRVGSAVMALLCLIVAWRLQATIVRPVRDLTRAMTALTQGASGVKVPGVARKDEIGEMARAAEVFQGSAQTRRAELEREAATQRAAANAERDAANAERERVARDQSKVIRSIGDALRALAGGDLQRRIETDFPAEFASLRDYFEEAREKLNVALRSVATSSALIAQEFGALSRGAENLSTRAEQQAAHLEESAAALQQLTVTVKASADGAARARTLVSRADDEAKRGAAVIEAAVGAMNGLSQSAKEIREITGLIDEIAFQTNLLALNAGVEAARAGDAGRGFAVVAMEVRALAGRSADMAKRISDLISNSDHQVEVGVAKVDATGDALGRIASEVRQLNGIVDSIASGAVDQARGLDEVNSAMKEMELSTQRNAEMAQQSSEATRRVSDEIAALDARVRQFRVGEGRKLRAA